MPDHCQIIARSSKVATTAKPIIAPMLAINMIQTPRDLKGFWLKGFWRFPVEEFIMTHDAGREVTESSNSPRLLPLQERQGPDHLCRQGEESAQSGAPVFPELARNGRQDAGTGRAHRRFRIHRHRHRSRSPDPRVEPDQAPQAALQRDAQG